MTMTHDQALAVLDAVARGCALYADACVGKKKEEWSLVCLERFDEARAYFASLPPKGEVTEEMMIRAFASKPESTDPFSGNFAWIGFGCKATPPKDSWQYRYVHAAITAALNTEKE